MKFRRLGCIRCIALTERLMLWIKVCLVCLTVIFIISVVKTIFTNEPRLSPAYIRLYHRNYYDIKYNSSRVEKILNDTKSILSSTRYLRDDVTVVTAYFDLGSFKKGDGPYYTKDLYRKWMTIFKYIENPTIAYFDSMEFCEYFKVLRQHMPQNRTRAIYVARQELWAFHILDKIDAIFHQPGYPKHNPNTVYPEYSSAMHAKYELMKRSVVENVFQTKYFAWVDIGLFRDMAIQKDVSPFGIYLPPRFSNNSIAYTMVYKREKRLTATDVIYNNGVWVCGCFFVGNIDTMLRWTIEYMEGVEWLIRRKLMNTDQQVIYILINAKLAKTAIQTYRGNGEHNKWFHLGYVARDVWLDRKIRAGVANASTI